MRNQSRRASRSRNISLAFGCIGLALFAATQAIAARMLLSNGSGANWELVERDGDHRCLLRTTILGGADRGIVDVDRSLGGHNLKLTMRGWAGGYSLPELRTDYSIGTVGGKSQQVTEYVTGDVRKVTLEFRDDEAAAIYKGSGVRFRFSYVAFVAIDSTGLVPLLAAVDACARDYFVELGVDPRMVAQIAVSPRAEDSDLFTTPDYPAAALQNKEQGTAIALAIVDQAGVVSNCRIVKSSEYEALDRATCDTLKHRKFEPATDASGKPVDAPTTLRIDWALRDGEPYWREPSPPSLCAVPPCMEVF